MKSLSPSAIPHIYNGVTILHRGDGYWNATAMCQANGKQWNDYWRLAETREFLAELSAETGIPVSGLVSVTKGGNPALQGTWVHRRVAIDIARWCSPRFAVRVNGWIDELISNGRVEVANPTLAPYTSRILQGWQVRRNLKPGFWCVFAESSDVLIAAERIFLPAGLRMETDDLLDGSVGRLWANFWRAQRWKTYRVEYEYTFPPPSNRGTILANSYPIHPDLSHFREWLHETYLSNHFPRYIQRKYGSGGFALAAPHIARVLPQALPASFSGAAKLAKPIE